jgi:CO/xanthine dehydrogenase Mo-binding subunit
MDELAHAAGADPLDFRLKHLTDPRERAVLEALRGDFTRGRGLAWVHYENTAAIVGAVADVSVDRKTGSVRVNHIWIAHDCGLVVNPNGLRNQIEGNAIQATSRAVHEAVQFQPHAVTSVDWVTYPILRFGEVPQVDIRLLDYPAQPVLGAGEATTTVIAPAIANAIFAQTGERVRSVPFTPQRVLAALSSA